MGDVPGQGTVVCEGEPRRVAEGCAERVARSARGVRAGCEGVAPAGVVGGAESAQAGAWLWLIASACQ